MIEISIGVDPHANFSFGVSYISVNGPRFAPQTML